MSKEYLVHSVKDKLLHIGLLLEQGQLFREDLEPELSRLCLAVDVAIDNVKRNSVNGSRAALKQKAEGV